MLDQYDFIKSTRKSPEADCPVVTIERTEKRLGGAANVAMNLRALEQNVTLIGVIGKDDIGRDLTQLCKEAGINADLVTDGTRCTTLKNRIVELDFKQNIRIDKESLDDIAIDFQNQMKSKIDNHLDKGIDIVILQDYNKGCLTEVLIKYIFEACKKRHLKVYVDPKNKHFELLSNAHLFKPNFKEFINYTGVDIPKTASEFDRIINAQKELKSQNYLITLSEHGIYYNDGQSSGIEPTSVLDDADVSGAGDTVIAVVAVLEQTHLSLQQIAQIANLCGATVCQIRGTSTIKLSDLQEFIHFVSSKN